MISKYLKGRVLVMIDAANLESAVKSLGWWIDYIKLRNLFNKENLVGLEIIAFVTIPITKINFSPFLKEIDLL